MGVSESSDAVTMNRSARSTSIDIQKFNMKKFLPSLTSTLLICYFILALFMNGGFYPLIKRGFFCNDSTIRYPIKTDTISFKWLIVIALIIPSIVIKICDRKLTRLLDKRVQYAKYNLDIRRRSRKRSDLSQENDPAEEEQLMTMPDRAKMRLVVNEVDSDFEAANKANQSDDEVEITDGDQHPKQVKPMAEYNCHKSSGHVRLFFFGWVSTAFFTGVGKMSGGRLRPHFMERCRPNIDCTSPDNMHRYVEDFNCTNNLGPREISYITTSWPSGHASMIFFSMIYLIIYLETVIGAIAMAMHRRDHKRVLDPILLYSIYVAMVGLAGYVSLTRISDYHHHPTDVLSGTIIGIIMAIVMAKCQLKFRIPSF